MKPSEITREYIAGILCAMQVAGDDEASAAIEHFIVQLEEENEALIKAHWEQMAETDYCYVCGEHGYNHPNKKCLLARKEAP